MLSAAVDLVLPRRCVGCAAPAVALCAECIAVLPQPRRRVVDDLPVAAAGEYRDVLQAVLISYKERGRRDLAGPLAALLAGAITQLPPAGPLVTVPSTRAAVRRRGGDHLLRLARRAAGGRPVRSPLRHVRPVADSAGLGVRDRARNLGHSMAAAPPTSVQRCVLVDDVLTTGATARESLRALRAAGWQPSGLAVIALVPPAQPASGRF